MRYLKIKYLFAVLVITSALAFNAPAARAGDMDDVDTSAVSDPLESVNRAIYKFNDMLDKALIKPVAKGYRFIVPELARRGVHNVLTNLSEPLTLANSALQGDVEHSFSTFWRFTINSTFGIAGMFDVAKDAGLKNRKEDFGQTIAVYGTGQGAYLMLPILGPSNVRDAFGDVVDIFMDPFTYIFTDEELIVKNLVEGVDKREATLDLKDQIDQTSLDPYAAIRSLYTQKRWDDVNNGRRKNYRF